MASLKEHGIKTITIKMNNHFKQNGHNNSVFI